MAEAKPDRIRSLDLIRGVAVLGILAVNIAGFSGPAVSTLSPNFPGAGTAADAWAFAAVFLLIEGKMRALFSILFGASMLLFIERRDATGAFGDLLQLRRLGWLALFGLAHFYLFWWGDILFLYAVAGTLALFMREMPVKRLVLTGLVIFAAWHGAGAVLSLSDIHEEENVRLGVASPAEIRSNTQALTNMRQGATRDLREYDSGFVELIEAKLTRDPFKPLRIVLLSMGETLPLMLFGMALFRAGFFSGAWNRKVLVRIAAAGIVVGGAMTLAMLAWAWPRQFPVRAMGHIVQYWCAPPHLAMALGYAALLVLFTRPVSQSWLGARLTAAGRMAFSNYLLTSVAMTGLFNGWGLGLAGRYGHAAQLVFVAGAWAVMLVWSELWLRRFRQGPLEWAWRSLTEGRMQPFRR
ncbi:MAG: DUF418 domain-containing protein [Novosphingobium sp.]